MPELNRGLPQGRGRDESTEERSDRNYNELLQELRVMQAGIQILFGFLLSLSFQARFVDVTTFQRNVYLGTLLVTTLSTCCLIAPVPFHRLVFRRGMKEDLIRVAQRYIGAGLAFLVLALLGSVMLVLDFLVDRDVALAISGVLAVIFLGLWLVLPMRARRHAERTDLP